jgi:glycosyltransferase involved in cell wall biosynthesis
MNFSVVIPAYNSENFVERAVKSVINQTVSADELIVVDDGSTDSTASIVEKIAQSNPQVKLIKQQNKLVGAARNNGIKHAESEFIAFLDSDDEYLPDFLETICSLITRFPESGAYATAYKVQKKEKYFVPKFSALPPFPWEGIVPSYYKSAIGYHPLSSSSVVLRKSIFSKIGFFSEGVRYGVDLDLWVRIAAKYEIAFSSKVCAVYHRDVGESLSVEKRTNFDRKVEETLENIIENREYKSKDEVYIKEFFNKLHLDTALKYIKAGNKLKAKEHLDKVKTKLFKFKKIKPQLKMLFMST